MDGWMDNRSRCVKVKVIPNIIFQMKLQKKKKKSLSNHHYLKLFIDAGYDRIMSNNLQFIYLRTFQES